MIQLVELVASGQQEESKYKIKMRHSFECLIFIL